VPAISVSIDSDLFARLQELAVPLVDTMDTVIARLLDNWQSTRNLEAMVVPHDPLMTNDRLKEFVQSEEAVKERALRDFIAFMEKTAGDPKEWAAFAEVVAKHSVDSEWLAGIDHKARPTHFMTSKGVALPVGLPLFADYQGNRLKAVVTERGIDCEGKVYSNPSQAAMAAKQAHGASQKASSTNGWTFWMIDLPQSDMKIKTLDHYRQAAGAKPDQDDGSEG
jgi:predicted transcriptional regulator